ncbi:MAG: L-histidine N(alpha)-methyltransferase [Alphaproteobacteria bacterium]|nr:MAG: L-histidine N(alpha)-methyltransferase [Alphaproteobacteria bacterium]
MTALARPAIRPQAARNAATAFAADVLEGLAATPKRLPAKYFYDEAGSRLFERITELPEYYPTRTELRILESSAESIAGLADPGAALIEFGSGSTAKARLLLRHMVSVRAYVPVDISAEFVNGEAARLQADFPALRVLPVAADFTGAFELPAAVKAGPRLGFFPGSTIGNLEPHEVTGFLRRAKRALGQAAAFVVGVDLVKDPEVLYAAYNDSQGVTAQFNRNLLVRINRELGADFDVSAFEHHAFYHRELRRIEMHLASLRRQKVRILSKCFEFRAGETIHTENSYKYTIESFAALARGAGWSIGAVWTDPERYFSVQALVPEAGGRRI